MYSFQTVERVVQVNTLVEIFNHPRPKGFYFQGESHDFWEGVYVHEGEVTATADEQVYQLRPGQILFHRPMEFHRIWSNPDCAPRIVNISFQADGELLQNMNYRCFDLNPQQQELFWKVVNAFSQAKRLKKEVDINHRHRITLNLAASLLEVFLIELSENNTYTSPSQSPNDERYSKIVQVMKANRHKNLSLDDLAEPEIVSDDVVLLITNSFIINKYGIAPLQVKHLKKVKVKQSVGKD